MLLKQTPKTQIGFSRILQSTLINLIGIKCAQCNLIFPQDMIEEHLVTHIQPKFLMPYQQTSGAKKLRSQLLLTEQTLSVKSADIASLKMETFPRRQSPRKNIQPPSDFQMIMHEIPPLKKDVVSYRGDQKDLYSRLQNVVQNEEIQHLTLTQDIELKKQETVLGVPQEISLYRSAKVAGIRERERVRTEKKVKPVEEEETEKSREYEIVSLRQDQGSQAQQQDRSLLLVNVKKHKQLTPRYDTINTSSAKKSQPFKSTASRLTESAQKPNQNVTFNLQTTSFLATSRSRFNHNNLQCQQCHGFYCSHCKSTIPPIYRPWNIQDIDPRIVQFYKDHVYKGKCEECEKNVK